MAPPNQRSPAILRHHHAGSIDMIYTRESLPDMNIAIKQIFENE